MLTVDLLSHLALVPHRSLTLTPLGVDFFRAYPGFKNLTLVLKILPWFGENLTLVLKTLPWFGKGYLDSREGILVHRIQDMGPSDLGIVVRNSQGRWNRIGKLLVGDER